MTPADFSPDSIAARVVADQAARIRELEAINAELLEACKALLKTSDGMAIFRIPEGYLEAVEKLQSAIAHAEAPK